MERPIIPVPRMAVVMLVLGLGLGGLVKWKARE